MTDEFAIQQNISTYSEGATRSDWDQVLSTFAPDGIWDIPVHNVKFQGHTEIRKGMIQFSSAMEYMLQANSPAVITVTGDNATARSVIREGGKFAGREEALEIHGIYNDKLIRTANGWKFAHRVFLLRGMFAYPIKPPTLG